jgi:hypothetical protein
METIQQRMRLLDWRPMRKGALRGFAAVELPIVGLQIFEVAVLVGQNGLWASLPNKPQLDRYGRRRMVNGELAYTRVLGFSSQRYTDSFSRGVVALVQAAYPRDLEEAPEGRVLPAVAFGT